MSPLTPEDISFDQKALSDGLIVPCPFCTDTKHISLLRQEERVYRYTCSSCGTDGPFARTPHLALQKWNKRNPILPEQVDSLFRDILHQLSTDHCLDCVPGAKKYQTLADAIRRQIHKDVNHET